MWGGVFALSDAVSPDFEQDTGIPRFEGAFFGFNARSALYLLLKHLQPAKVWLPAYLCPELLKALPAGQSWGYYALDSQLKPASDSWLEQLSPGDLVLAIAYLGFAPDPSWLAQVRARGAQLLLDASQALYLTPSHPQDYLLYSPRKWGGVSDGGLLIGPHLPPLPTQQDAPPAWDLMHRAQTLRRAFETQGQNNRQLQAEWFDLFRQAESLQPVGAWAMTETSQKHLQSLLKDPMLPLQRRKNYQRLSAALADWALFPELPAETVPLGFALCARQRNALQAALAETRIYCPIYWPLADLVPETFRESHWLADRLLSLPCDQRYSEADMDIILTRIEALKHLL
ncbi:MAG: hypothetical protein AB7I41_11910 [Candidatus Sericytochromatia bacterium]